jgi:hypothetical protein
VARGVTYWGQRRVEKGEVVIVHMPPTGNPYTRTFKGTVLSATTAGLKMDCGHYVYPRLPMPVAESIYLYKTRELIWRVPPPAPLVERRRREIDEQEQDQ